MELVFYWGIKITLWIAVAITGGAGMAQSATLAGTTEILGGATMALDPGMGAIVIPIPSAMATSDKEISPAVIDRSAFVTTQLIFDAAKNETGALEGGPKVTTIVSAVKGFLLELAGSIESISLAAGAVGTALPTP
jgi:hypothetical protein